MSKQSSYTLSRSSNQESSHSQIRDNVNGIYIVQNKSLTTTSYVERVDRPRRACATRSSPGFYSLTTKARRRRAKETPVKIVEEEEEEILQSVQCSKIVTSLADCGSTLELPRLSLRSMWELASVLNFLNVFRPLLNIKVEFSAEELETALLTPNSTLEDIHIPLLKAIPPVTRMAMGRDTWVTVLCRKLRDWWYWVAEGEIPIVASHGAETEVYKTLNPATRVLILKALCDIRVEQDDIRSYIDGNLKHGVQLCVFRKKRIGGDSHGISYWYEDDPVIGHRLYREIRYLELNKVKSKGILSLPTPSCQWETVATNFDEFQDVSEKLFSSKNRTEVAVGKKLKNDMLPEIEKIFKRKEKLIKKQHREAILLDSFLATDGIASVGRSLRDRKPVTYTFDDYDQSINEAINTTKCRKSSPEFVARNEVVWKPEASIDGDGPSPAPQPFSDDLPYAEPIGDEETDGCHKPGPLDRSNRRRQRPQRYSVKEFVEDVSDDDAGFDSDDEIVGEAIYDEEYLRSRKRIKVINISKGDDDNDNDVIGEAIYNEEYLSRKNRKVIKFSEEDDDVIGEVIYDETYTNNRKQRKIMSSTSEADEEYHVEEESLEDVEEDDISFSSREDSDEAHRHKRLPNQLKRGVKIRSIAEIQSGLRRSERATRNQTNYHLFELSDSEDEEMNLKMSKPPRRLSNASDVEYSTGSQGLQEDDIDTKIPVQNFDGTVDQNNLLKEKISSAAKFMQTRQFLDLNELAPGTGFDNGPDLTHL
ncbi:hypothetical protein ACHQM5_006004 [Ranunculus cassubicifolius]